MRSYPAVVSDPTSGDVTGWLIGELMPELEFGNLFGDQKCLAQKALVPTGAYCAFAARIPALDAALHRAQPHRSVASCLRSVAIRPLDW